VEPSPREQARDFNIVTADADVVVVFPEDGVFQTGEVMIAAVDSGFVADFKNPIMKSENQKVTDLKEGQYRATYTSMDKQWRGDSGVVSVKAGAVNMFVIEVKKIDRRLRVGGWESGQLKTQFSERTWDVTEFLASGGRLAFLVEYTRGDHAAAIQWAALLEDGREIARDTHNGWAGTNRWGNVYRMNLADRKPGARYELRMSMKSDGGTDSAGNVYLNLN